MNQEERRKIYLNNLSKVKNRTGRPKKNGKRITVRLDETIFLSITHYANKEEQDLEMIINQILLEFLKPKIERVINNVPQYYVSKTHQINIGKKS
jgi:hypothetical protein